MTVVPLKGIRSDRRDDERSSASSDGPSHRTYAPPPRIILALRRSQCRPVQVRGAKARQVNQPDCAGSEFADTEVLIEGRLPSEGQHGTQLGFDYDAASAMSVTSAVGISSRCLISWHAFPRTR